MPRPTDSDPCGSKSTSSTRRPCAASAAPRLIVVVVLPTPPFWLHTATTRAGPCSTRIDGTGNCGSGRPVRPSVGGVEGEDGTAELLCPTSLNPARQPMRLLARSA